MLMGKLIEKYYIIQIFKNKICKHVQIFFNELIVKPSKNGTNLTNLSLFVTCFGHHYHTSLF